LVVAAFAFAPACSLFADAALDGFTGGRIDSEGGPEVGGVETSAPDADSGGEDVAQPMQGCAGETSDGGFFLCFDYDDSDAAPPAVTGAARLYPAPDDAAPSSPNALVVDLDGGGSSGFQLVKVAPFTSKPRSVSVDFWMKVRLPFAGRLTTIAIGDSLISINIPTNGGLQVGELARLTQPDAAPTIFHSDWPASIGAWTHVVMDVSVENQKLTLVVDGTEILKDKSLRRAAPLAPVEVQIGLAYTAAASATVRFDNVVVRARF
jgi:hypothetical protein